MLSVASVGIEDEDVTVFAGDLDCLGGVGLLVEQVETRFPFVVWDPFADGLPGWLDGLERLDVEWWIGRWRDVDDAFPETLRHSESVPLYASLCPDSAAEDTTMRPSLVHL